ncbi:MAG: hypothetical protein VX267_03750, partial [Candidatus Thermoplasmatota archaeon]|nr:hypothetical protein [Candidatus Thermoplasmatota archaeon]
MALTAASLGVLNLGKGLDDGATRADVDALPQDAWSEDMVLLASEIHLMEEIVHVGVTTDAAPDGDVAEHADALEELRARALDHVRWRITVDRAPTVEFCSLMDAVTAVVRQSLTVPGQTCASDLGRLTASVGTYNDCKEFVEGMHKAALRVTDQNTMAKRLLSRLPDITFAKFGDEVMNSAASKEHAIVSLVSKHAGEVVEPVPADYGTVATMGWELHKHEPANATARKRYRYWHAQFYCNECGGEARGEIEPIEYGKPVAPEVARDIDQRIEDMARVTGDSPLEFQPDWRRQWNRLLVPCGGTVPFEWRRTGQVTTLGQLFLTLGDQWNAAIIYEYYLRLRMVAVKKRKKSGSGRQSGREST